MSLTAGTRVCYEDEDPANPEFVGTVVEPTTEELVHVKTYSDPVGPEHGDVLVAWDGDASWDRSWNAQRDLQVLTTSRDAS